MGIGLPTMGKEPIKCSDRDSFKETSYNSLCYDGFFLRRLSRRAGLIVNDLEAAITNQQRGQGVLQVEAREDNSNSLPMRPNLSNQ